MEKFATENLILLEFLVDQINMDYAVQKEVSSIMGETCVSFQFLDNAALQICEQDFSNKQQLGTDQNVKSGKSCLFSLTPQQAQDCSKTFDIYVEIFKKMAKGVLPDQIPIGTSLISIVNLFNELVDSINTSGETPAAKTLKDCFKITNPKGDDVGHISVYIRMSCFGKLIVTQFQMNLEDKSVQFKAKEGHYLFKYNKGRGGPGGKSNACEDWQKRMQPLNPTCPQTSCQDALMKMQQQQQQPQPQPPPPSQIQLTSPQKPATSPDSQSCPIIKKDPQPQQDKSCPLQPCLFHPNAPPMSLGMQPGYSQMLPQGGMGGPPCGMPPQQMQQSAAPCAQCMPNMPLMPQLPYGPQGGFPYGGYPPMPYTPQSNAPCKECGQPRDPDDPNAAYQEIGASMGSNAITIRVHKDKAKVEDITDTDITESDSRSCQCFVDRCGKMRQKKKEKKPGCTPRSMPPAMRPPAGVPDPSGPFNLKMGGCGQAAANNVVVSPPACTAKDGTVFTQLSDPNKDVFVLRIGKKSEGVDKKNNLELELCTPKGPDIKPTPKKETVDTQYDEADLKDKKDGDKKDGKDKKGKGKGDKGGKDKGGKGKGGKGKGGKGKGGKDKGGKKGKGKKK